MCYCIWISQNPDKEHLIREYLTQPMRVQIAGLPHKVIIHNQSKINVSNKEYSDWLGGNQWSHLLCSFIKIFGDIYTLCILSAIIYPKVKFLFRSDFMSILHLHPMIINSNVNMIREVHEVLTCWQPITNYMETCGEQMLWIFINTKSNVLSKVG